jgi:biopolymer transport protein ExbD
MEPECVAGVSTHMDSRKPVNAELNLVPFIDLLSCCISFLLITAVWTQLDRIAVRASGDGAVTGEADGPPALLVVIDEAGYRVRDRDLTVTIPKHEGQYDRVALGVKLHEWAGGRNAVEFSSADGIRYEEVVGAMDTAYGAGLHDVSLRAP